MKYIIMLFLCILGSYSFAQSSGSSNRIVSVKGGHYVPLYSLDSQKVFVNNFSMDVYPVTNIDYLRFVQKYPEWKKSRTKSLFADSNYLQQWKNDTTFNANIGNSPVVNISWFAAKKYCECEGKRLPTTAEWELAARASKSKADASKDTLFSQWILDWASKPNPKVLPNVGRTFKNYFGIYDLHGLVWEWTYDFNNALTTGESRGNSGLDNTLFCGGGSFASKDVNNYASFLRFATRSSLKAKYCVGNLGFRCVK